MKLRAAQPAIDKKASFHRDKNTMADAFIVETYAECVRDKKGSGARFAFVTHNKHDFSAVGSSQKLPHPDLANIFSHVKSLYFVNLPSVVEWFPARFLVSVGEASQHRRFAARLM